ncbi:Uncharacterised protein [Bordetella pertussis]|nr:Uncharacterised protein [Bordetella pertussis]
MLPASKAALRFSSTFMLAKISRPSGTSSRPARTRWWVGVASMRRPSRRISPRTVGRPRDQPSRALTRVDLPAPLAPITPTISPRPTDSLSRPSAWLPA